MGKQWDYDVPSVDIWKECLRVLKPGGHLLAFAGSRTYHRMAVRIEDAGFEIRDMISWLYAQGFPKSRDVYKNDILSNIEAQLKEQFDGDIEWK
jgi:site-specific DNA-methyltransferase (adenine-specific)